MKIFSDLATTVFSIGLFCKIGWLLKEIQSLQGDVFFCRHESWKHNFCRGGNLGNFWFSFLCGNKKTHPFFVSFLVLQIHLPFQQPATKDLDRHKNASVPSVGGALKRWRQRHCEMHISCWASNPTRETLAFKPPVSFTNATVGGVLFEGS